jgi:outer membrane protein assembly complex protein YaeT
LYGLSFLPAHAQTRDFEGQRIVDVQFDPAPAPLSSQDLARMMAVKKDAPYRAEDVAATIDSLYASGRFEDIQVDAEPSGDGVVVRFLTKLNFFSGHIEITGKVSNPPDRGLLISTTQLSLGSKYRDPQLTSAEEDLKKLLEANGLYEASVQPQVTRDARTQTVNFTFHLKPGKRAKYTFPVVNGNAQLSDQTILRVTSWRIPLIHWWRHVTQVNTRAGVEGIEKKYQKMDRLTATVKLDSLDYDPDKRRVQPNLTLDAGPKVEIKAVEAKVSKGRLKRYVPVYQEGTVDRDLLVEGARNLRDYFQSQGYYDVAIDFRQLPPQKDQLTIEYTISKGNRYKLASVQIEGNKYFANADLRDRIFLHPASLIDRHGRYSEEFRKSDAGAIENLYRSNGFQSVKVTSEVRNNYKGLPQNIQVIYHVNEGPQWFVDNLALNGIDRLSKPVMEALRAQLSSVPGQPYSLVNVAQDRNAILTAYFAHGFPAAELTYKVQPASEQNHVNLVYDVKEGGQEFVRDVLLSGLRITRRKLVDKKIKIHAGEELSPTEISAIQRDLYNLDVFAKVNATVQNPEGDEQYKYVLYDFEEANRYSVNVGIGAEVAQFGGTTTQLDNPGGSPGFSPRVSLDVSRLNFLGTGDRIDFRSRVSNLEQLLSIDFQQKHFLGSDNRTITYMVVYDNARDVLTFASKREEASVNVSQRFSKSLRAQFGFAYRRVSVSDIIIPTLLVPQLLQPVRIGILTANVIQDRRDNPADAHRGMYNTADIGVASSIFGSQRDFNRILLKNATYTPITPKIVFARQTQFGLILPYNPPAGISAEESVPLPERFFSGGSDSNRGFPYNQAGPRDIGQPAAEGATATQPTGFPVGGNALFFNTFELRFPLLGSNIGGVVFHDMGNVFSSASAITLRSTQRNLQDFDYLVHAVGFGIRYKTPVGPVRVDLAYSINPPSYQGFSGTVQQLLACNPNLPPSQLPAVCTPTQQSVSHFQFSFSIGQAF